MRTKNTGVLFTLIVLLINFLFVSENILRRRFCNSVKPKGLELVPPTAQLRRLTVFLNPFARHGSLLKEFEKNVAPLLQLSGLDVQMVYTDNDFETKDFVRVLDPQSTDGILVASDDHVLQKVVTALLERPELTTGPRLIPVGIVPVGVWNTFASTVTRPRDQPRYG
ncbi:unnamed protein product [Echinostoma caproni]|uniref:DAGKc domain-containing protein n=1 Tax=Echinostoma caproni TaxID=27848 RepID=A0A183BF39_9TREM|nr:unnamed protein product [Echinostoma caproni]